MLMEFAYFGLALIFASVLTYLMTNGFFAGYENLNDYDPEKNNDFKEGELK